MSFVYPQFLWASFLIGIPIIIHLFNFRRYKTIYFSRVKFLKELTEDSKSGTQLKHLLVLFARILAILALVFAFAQPYIPAAKGESTSNVNSIYIDNSYSMQAEGQDGNLLNEVKNRAIDLVKSFEENEKINLLTSDLLSSQQRFYTKGEVIEMIKEIDFSPQSTKLSTALNLQLDLLNGIEEKSNKRVFLFSDFQKKTTGLEGWSREGASTYYYQAKPEMTENIFIDSIWFETPVHRIDVPIDIFFRVRNQSDQDIEGLGVKVKFDANVSGPKSVDIPANSFAIDTLNFTDRTAGVKSGSIFLSSNQLFFDDEFFFSYEIKNEVNILIVKHQGDMSINLEQLYGVDDYYNAELREIEMVTQDEFANKELIIFQNINRISGGVQDLAKNAIKNGATVVMIPGEELDLGNWNDFMMAYSLPTFSSLVYNRSELTYFNHDDPIYSGVFESTPKDFKKPTTNGTFQLNASGSSNYISLFGKNAVNPFLYYSKTANGRLVVMTSPLDPDFTDFQNHALFAATFLRLAETATFQKPLFLTIGEMENFPLNVPNKNEIGNEEPVHLKNKEFEVDVIPQIINSNRSRVISFSHLEDNLRYAGFYQLTDDKSIDEELAINYSRSESYIESFTREEIQNNFKDIGWEIEPLSVSESGSIEINSLKPTEFWRWLIILALIFIATEILLLKFWKT